jgi:hypothetical protein
MQAAASVAAGCYPRFEMPLTIDPAPMPGK